MAWEMRGRFGPYYYIKQRVGKSVKSVYVGPGRRGQLGENEVLEFRLEKNEMLRIQREKEASAEKELSELMNAFKETDRLLNEAVVKELKAAGLHKSARYKWRRRRDKSTIAVS